MTTTHVITRTNGKGLGYPKYTIDGEDATNEEFLAMAKKPNSSVKWIGDVYYKNDGVPHAREERFQVTLRA